MKLRPPSLQVAVGGLVTLGAESVAEAFFPVSGKSAMACLDGDPSTICGYDAQACGDPLLVEEGWRRGGV